MSPHASDYGDANDKALVPGSLLVYRHFLADTASGLLYPMNWNPQRNRMGWGSGQGAYQPPSFRIDAEAGEYKEPVAETYTAECIASHPNALRGIQHDKAPTTWCKCGFYAHYDPATDFYPSYRWGRLYHQLAGNRGAESLVVVRAVAEVSGTVVMGKLGVRAEKMKILALAIDWDKRITPGPVDRYNFEMNRRARDPFTYDRANMYRVHSGYVDSYRYGFYAEEDEENDEYTIARVQAIARLYDVRYYGDVKAMYGDHPKPDISALVEEAAPKPEPTRQELYAATDTRPIMSMPVQFGKTAYLDSLKAQVQLYGSWAGPTADLVIVDEATATPFERAILNKKNRPAPPGTGIDRRRGKLR